MTALLGIHDRARSMQRRVSDSLIERTRLDHFYESATGRVIRVLAPGGFGKSSLVARWIAEDDRQVVWLDLEPIDNDAGVLANSLTAAMFELNADGFAALPVAMVGSQSFRDWVVPGLAAAVRDCTEPFVLVCDDIHEIHNPDADDVLCAVAENLPPHATLVLAGRSHRIDRSIAKLRLEPGVIDVTTLDLALEPAEARSLLHAMGLEDSVNLDGVVERFEGWPAGLRLAGQVMLTSPDTTALTAVDVADATYVTDYLSAEWTSSVDPDDVPLLREAACLGRFTAEMCDEVLGRTGSRRTLRRLEREAQLVLPLDVRGEWFRMHPLLAGWLEAELRGAQRQRWRDVHASASAWWEANGDIDRALDHAFEIGDIDRCEDLVFTHATIRFPQGGHDTVRRWLARVPEDRMRASAVLCSYASMAASHSGDGAAALQWSSRLAHLVDLDGPGADPDDPMLWIAETLRSTLEVRSSRSLIDSATRARANLSDDTWRQLTEWVLGAHMFMVGDHRAFDIWDEAARSAEHSGAPLLAASCLSSAAIAHDLSGHRDRAVELGTHAQRLIRSTNGTHIPSAAITVSMSSLIEARRGRHDIAATEMGIARGHLAAHDTVGPWFNVLARFALVQTALVLDDRPTARVLLRELERFAGRPGDAAGVEPYIAALWAKIDAVSHVADGSGSLTPSERKVLEYLPTNLTLSEIAAELFVSRNTVKSHAAAIYRKFGTATRSDAVALARAAGMIDDATSDR
ncbi:MAG: LuxR C-terminal-related transcriptional regulator [Ilumatobacteraceae bacterium]